MKLTYRLCVFLSIALLASTPMSLAQPAEGEAPSEAPSETEATVQDIFSLWNERSQALENEVENLAVIQDLEEQVRELQLDLGIPRLQVLAIALTYEGKDHLVNGRHGLALRRFQRAISYDPAFTDAYIGAARARASMGITSLPSAVSYWVSGVFHGAQDFWRSFFLMGRWFLTIITALMAGLLVVLTIFVLTFNRVIRHDVAELIPEWVIEPVRNNVGWLLIIGPFLAGPGLAWLVIWMAVLVWSYLPRGGRVFIVLCFAMLILSGPITSFTNVLLTAYDDPTNQALTSAVYGGYNPIVTRQLEEELERNPDDSLIHFTLGLSKQRAGMHEEALEHWKTLEQLTPFDYRVHLNMGNVYFAQDDSKRAIEAFQEASRLQPNSAAPLFNLNKAYLYLERFEFQQAADALQRARKLDSDLVAHYSNISGSSPVVNRALISASVTWTSLWSWIMSRASTRTSQSDTHQIQLLEARVWGVSSENLPFLALTGLIGVFLIGALRSRVGVARSCIMCGRATCPKCQRSYESDKYCSHCLQLFIKREGVDQETREVKLSEINTYEKRSSLTRKLSSLVVPGAGSIVNGNIVGGSVLVLIWVFIIACWLLAGHLPRVPYEVNLGDSKLPMYAGIAVTAGVWLVVNFQSLTSDN